MYNIKIDILPNKYLKENGFFDKENAINICGKIAGVCYDKEGFSHLENEKIEKTKRRIDLTLNNGHHSVYDHIYISFNLQNIPKILAMMLNNEHQYTTSEKSARYTPIVREENGIITEKEVELYNKWIDIFKDKIKIIYGEIYNDSKIQKLAQENARYFVTVFMPTQMIYTTSFRQINYIASWMYDFIKNANSDFDKKIAISMQEFLNELNRLEVLEDGLLKNEKFRKFSLFDKNLNDKQDYFGDIYATKYKGSFAEVAQLQRHRTIKYKIELLNKKDYFIPVIIQDDENLVKQWKEDMEKVKDISPQGELVMIYETGKFEDFILKCKERLCTAAQLEIMLQTKETLDKYQTELEKNNNSLYEKIKQYSKGARCTFKDFVCLQDCNFKEGKTLLRKI